MNKTILILPAIFMNLVFGQDGAVVSKAMIGSFNFTQAAHDNWAQGGEDILSWFMDVKGDVKRETATSVFQLSGHANYGKTKISNTAARKSMDELKLDLLYTMKMGWSVNPYATAQLLTQLASGYVYTDMGKSQVSAFMDPGYLIQTIGVGHAMADKYAIRAGVSLKETVSNQYPVSIADEPAGTVEKFRMEFGFQGEVDIKKQIGNKTILTSEMDIFSNLEGLDVIDVIWDTNLNTAISEYVQFGFQYKIIYDRDVSPKRQVKSILSIGINYTFL